MSGSLSVIPFIVSIAICQRLGKSTELYALQPKWSDLFRKGTYAAFAIFLVELIFIHSFIFLWLWHIAVLLLMAQVLTKKELQDGRSLVMALLPLEILNFLSNIFEKVLPMEYRKVDDYADAAIFFAALWAGAMFFYGRKQQKRLDKERLKRKQEEELYKITEVQKAALEVTVRERTAELTEQKEELQKSLLELRSAQDQLIQSEKMASLGELTAGIAHEIQNPLNFVNNFSEVSVELLDEMEEEIGRGNQEEVKHLALDVKQNLQKIIQHGRRADAIVKGMLQHSRISSGQKELTDINALADEYFRLSYHGLRAKDKTFNAALQSDFSQDVPKINIIPQDIGRVLLNLYNNAFYAVGEKKNKLDQEPAGGGNYQPTVSVTTKYLTHPSGTDGIEIRVKDNGMGISEKASDKIFQPFYTTKPTGQGTGLGLSLSYDIITKGHGGTLKMESKEGQGAEFIIFLENKEPRTNE